MPIKLAELRIGNFRSCADVQIQLSQVTALIGYNNSGKSSILDAIVWLLRRQSLGSSDFFDLTQPIIVEATFSDIDQSDIGLLPDNQSRQIAPYIVQGILRTRRVQANPAAKVSDCKLEVGDPRTNEWRPAPTGMDTTLSVLLPDPITIGAMEDAAEDATKSKTTTTIGKLLAEFTAPIQKAHADEINLHLQRVVDLLSSSGVSRIAELSEIDRRINEKLLDVFPGITIKLHFDTPGFSEIIKTGTLRVAEDAGIERDFISFGHGTQRSIQMTLIRHLAELRREKAKAGTTLLLIDEPELYLHPFAIEQVRSALKVLAGAGYQVIYSTHSAQMIEPADSQNALLVRKGRDGKCIVRRRMRDAINTLVPDADHQIEHLFSLSNSSQFLFSDYVVLVEGKTERKLLPIIFHSALGKSLGQMKIALLALDGITNLSNTMAILNEMDLPTKAVVDLDYAFNNAIINGHLRKDDPDIVALLLQLERLESRGEITLHDDTRLPINGIQGKAYVAYQILALEVDSAKNIESIHKKLLDQHIWLWTKGTIEPHLGLQGKTERHWAIFIDRVSKDGYAEACSNDQKAISILEWLTTL